MLKIGLTGGIGSGKTLIAKLFGQLGIPVYNSDVKAKELTNSSSVIRNALIELLGEDVYLPGGQLNKMFLAQNIFSTPQTMKLVNSIIHPVVANDFDKWVQQHQNFSYVIKEAAILFESGAYKQVDKTVLVVADVDTRIERVIKRDKLAEDEIKKRISNQMSDIEKEKLSDYIIKNRKSDMLIPQVLKLHEIFKNQTKL